MINVFIVLWQQILSRVVNKLNQLSVLLSVYFSVLALLHKVSMKKIHIVLLIIVAISIGGIIAMTGDYTTYGNFSQSKKNPKTVLNVVGYLAKEKPINYNPEKDPNYFEFTMVDKENGEEQIVFYRGSKPQDFERSEQLVVKGKMEGDLFHASEILMKCPSKYNDDEIRLKEKA